MHKSGMTLKIILHAGTPKTGTTSLQVFLDLQRDALLERGILYPRAGITSASVPKHQWMIGGLMNDAPSHFEAMLNAALGELRPSTHTMILSSEGLFNHWWDFSPTGLSTLAALSARFHLEFWTFFREPSSFFRSLYIQYLKNPQTSGSLYGLDLSAREFLENPRVSIYLDYMAYIRSVEAVIGNAKVRPFHYRGDTIQEFMAALQIEDLQPTVTQENRSVGQLGVELLRSINRRELDVAQKNRAVLLVEELDRLVDDGARPLQLEPDVVTRVRALSASSVSAFAQIYGLSIDQPLTKTS